MICNTTGKPQNNAPFHNFLLSPSVVSFIVKIPCYNTNPAIKNKIFDPFRFGEPLENSGISGLHQPSRHDLIRHDLIRMHVCWAVDLFLQFILRHLELTIGVQRGVSKGVEDCRRLPILLVGHLWNCREAISRVACPQGVKWYGMAGPGETSGSLWPPHAIHPCNWRNMMILAG
jgi:hypothetical protein